MGFKHLEDLGEIPALINDCERIAFIPDAYNFFFETN
jgi:hypothetical protein